MSREEIIIKSRLTPQKYPYNSIIELVVDRLETDSEKTCIVDTFLNRRWSKQQVLDSSLNFAYYLINDCGLKNGDIVCFLCINSDIHAIAILGVLMAGAVYTSIDDEAPQREIREVVSNIKPEVMVCSNENYTKVKKITEEFSLKIALVIERESNEKVKDQTNQDHIIYVEDIFKIERNPKLILPRADGLDGIATIGMSSGSTGRPKAIPRTNRNFLAEVAAMGNVEMRPFTTEDILHVNYFGHNISQRTIFSAINAGALMAIIRNAGKIEEFFGDINKYKITSTTMIPTQLIKMIKNSEKYNKELIKSLTDVISVGAYLSEVIYKAVVQTYNFPYFRNSYGMSECGRLLMVYKSDSRKLSNVTTIGKLSPGIEAKVIDGNGICLGPNKQGQICYRGDQVSPGYLNNAEESAKAFTSDGFLKSGDLGYYDENEFFYYVSRIKEIIKVGAMVVAPAELETILLENTEIETAAVIGIKDDALIEVPLAFVTLKAGSNLTAEQIQEFVDSQVSNIKRLRGGVRILDKFPMTPMKKIDKMALKKLLPHPL